MPFTLLVLYEWKPHITPERIEVHFTRIRGLAGNVPGLIEVRVGPRTFGFGPTGSEKWTHAGLMVFERQSDYAAFGKSAAHDAIAPDLVADLANLLAVGMT
jgi:hypothetical protein